MKVAHVSTETTALAHTGRGFKLQPGTYEFIDIDGAADRGVAYVKGTDDGALVCVSLTDRNIHFTEEH